MIMLAVSIIAGGIAAICYIYYEVVDLIDKKNRKEK